MVEAAGIEPASGNTSTGLLRAYQVDRCSPAGASTCKRTRRLSPLCFRGWSGRKITH